MSAADTIEAAAAGRLPAWARLSDRRRAHAGRVAALMDEWASGYGLEPAARARWRAAGWLHDALRDADPDTLRDRLRPPFDDLPASALHGPAVAERLRAEGVADEALLAAIAYHTLGHPNFERLGTALYLADYLEPGRAFAPAWRASLRARMPDATERVLPKVAAARIRFLLASGLPLRPETVAFWNAVAGRAA